MKRVARICLLLLLLLVVGGGSWVYGVRSGWFGKGETRGEIIGKALPAAEVERRGTVQLATALRAGVERPKQILFGDFHVHTTFSFDAFLLSLPLTAGTGSHPPADACDFARYCSQLDFWSINDHAEGLSQRLWKETVESIRECNAIAGNPEDPDLVSFLGWEWSQIGLTRETHYGHKNVVILGLEDDEIPRRPIASSGGLAELGGLLSSRALTALSLVNGQRGRDLAYLLAEPRRQELCPDGVAVRELPPDCYESTPTPAGLFAKLRDWGFPSIVIPHGTTWGLYSPPGSTWEQQIAGSDPGLETLVEVYSGHGNSEEYRDWRAARVRDDGSASCPEPSASYLPSCWQAGELVRESCLEAGETDAECEDRAIEARQNYLDAGLAGWRTVPGRPPEDWLDAGQCTDCFLPTFNHRPGGSVQYMLAKRSFEDGGDPKGLRMGFISSSDLHTGRAGPGYKEFARGLMTEGRGLRSDVSRPTFLARRPGPAAVRSRPIDPYNSQYRGIQLFEAERGSSYFLTGGLVAVHSAGRSREAIWSGIGRKEVYATSGPRMLLWFDLLGDDGQVRPMGSELSSTATPRFRVRAVGSFEQRPGCPDFVRNALGSERLEEICLGECYHPSDQRRPITRVEVVRIRPQIRADEPLPALIEDPWRTFPCDGDPAGCVVSFEDPEFSEVQRDTVYYVRAIEAPSPAIHADPLHCRTDAQGRCVEVNLCGPSTPAEDDCLDDTEERAWSSPIYLDWADG